MVSSQLPSNIFGQYEIHEQIGKGGMGVVYRAYQSTLGREVAVKILSIFQSSPLDIRRFQAEAKTAATLEHPNIVPVYDFGTQDGVNFVVMRLLTGGSLAQRIGADKGTSHPPLSLQDIAQVTLQVASALDYAHSKGVIHRDVKPTNILFDDHEVPYLVDFGIVKLLHESTSLTGSDEIVGSLPFIAPDQLRGEVLTPAADQYALAVTVYAMLTDHLPHEADSPYVLMNKRLNSPPTPLQTYRPDLPKTVAKVLHRGLETEAAKRYETVSAFALALYDAILQHENLQQATLPPVSIASRKILKDYKPPSADSSRNAAAQISQPRFSLKLVLMGIALLIIVVSGVALFSNRPPAGAIVNTTQPTATVLNVTGTPAPCRVRMRDRAYVRSGPSTDSDVIRAYDSGWTTAVVGKTTDADGSLWWYVEVPSLTANYWVADAVTQQIGDCTTVPTITP